MHFCTIHCTLTENAKLHEVFLFLFDEFLLITKLKRTKKVGLSLLGSFMTVSQSYSAMIPCLVS